MNIYEVNPYIRLTKRHTMSWDMAQRIILDYELLYCDGGRCTLWYDGVDYQIKQGDILLICPGVEHRFHDVENLVQPHIHFDIQYDDVSELVYICFQRKDELPPNELQYLRKNIFYQDHRSPIIRVENPPTFVKLFYETVDSFQSNYMVAHANMILLLDMIERYNFPRTFEAAHHINPMCISVKKYLKDNCDKPLQLEALESFFNYSRFYISKQFKKEYGISVMAYHRNKRMELAKSLLKQYSVSEVGDRLGFTSIFAFSRAFKEHYGVSPLHYHTEAEKPTDADEERPG